MQDYLNKIENKRFLILLFILLSLRNAAQNYTPFRKAIQLTIDNDVLNFRGRGTYRYYTSGIQLEISHRQKNKNSLSNFFLVNLNDGTKNLEHWSFTQLIHTPTNTEETIVINRDRLNAGAFFISKGLTPFNEKLKLTVRSEVNIGIIGPIVLLKTPMRSANLQAPLF